jgi:hypothetical protein
VIRSSAELSTDIAGGRLWYGEIGWRLARRRTTQRREAQSS